MHPYLPASEISHENTLILWKAKAETSRYYIVIGLSSSFSTFTNKEAAVKVFYLPVTVLGFNFSFTVFCF